MFSQICPPNFLVTYIAQSFDLTWSLIPRKLGGTPHSEASQSDSLLRIVLQAPQHQVSSQASSCTARLHWQTTAGRRSTVQLTQKNLQPGQAAPQTTSTPQHRETRQYNVSVTPDLSEHVSQSLSQLTQNRTYLHSLHRLQRQRAVQCQHLYDWTCQTLCLWSAVWREFWFSHPSVWKEKTNLLFIVNF